MKKLLTILVGFGLISWGLLFMFGGVLLPVLGMEVTWLQPWRFWPLFVVAVGDFLVVLALLLYRRRGSGAIFIPALPVLTTGVILLYASLFDHWHVWSYAWSLIILALAAGFVVAGITSRVIWFGIPAIIIGLNAVVLTFCSFTGLWSWWSFLWVIEPLSVGLIMLLIAYKTRARVVGLIGLIFCALAAAAFPAMTGLAAFGGAALGLFWPGLFFLVGGYLLYRGLMSRSIAHMNQ